MAEFLTREVSHSPNITLETGLSVAIWTSRIVQRTAC
jgi:hypothetical protein